MPGAVNRYSDGGISPRTKVYAQKKMLESADPVRVLDICADVKPVPRNKNLNVSFRRPVTLAPVDTPLVEGVTPETTPFRFENVEGTLRQYGQVLGITDVIQDTHEDPVLMEMSKQLGKNIGRTNERLMWGVLRAGTNVFYASGSTAGTAAASRSALQATITLGLQRQICMALETQYAEMITEITDGSVMINTTPVEAGYVGFCHTHLKSAIRNMPGFVPTAEYGKRMLLHPREFGAVEDVRYIASPDLTPILGAGGTGGADFRRADGTNNDVYPILYCGMHAYGTCPLRGRSSMEPKVIPVDQADKSDPLGQRGYVSAKWWFLCMRLNELWMARAEVLADAGIQQQGL